MNALTRTKLSVYLAVIFVAGLVSGGVLALRKADQRSQLPTMEKVCHQMENQLKSRLGLTDAEFARIRPLLDESARELQQIHSRTLHEIDAAIRRHHAELARFLTPEQQRILEKMDEERRHRAMKRGKPCDGPNDNPSPTR